MIEFLRMLLLVMDYEKRFSKCHAKGCMSYVGRSGYYRGMPQSHCWRCGEPIPYHWPDGTGRWQRPLGLASD